MEDTVRKCTHSCSFICFFFKKKFTESVNFIGKDHALMCYENESSVPFKYGLLITHNLIVFCKRYFSFVSCHTMATVLVFGQSPTCTTYQALASGA